MGYEKKYKEALEIAKSFINPNRLGATKEELVQMFPELKESEDERVRKYLIKCVNENMFVKPFNADDVDKQTILAWLEMHSKASKVEAAMCEVETKSKIFTEANKGETSEEILAQMKGEWWSEEDWDYYAAIIAKLEVTQDDALLTDNQMEFLRSLKNRVLPQPKQEWKPSDEQIRPLGYAIDYFRKKKNDITYLESLYQDLMKLREE